MSFENAMPVDMFLLDTLKNAVVARGTKVAPVECPRWFPVRLLRNDDDDDEITPRNDPDIPDESDGI